MLKNCYFTRCNFLSLYKLLFSTSCHKLRIKLVYKPTMNITLDSKDFSSMRETYYNLLAHFINMEAAKEDFIDGIFKWGLQLSISKKEIYDIIAEPQKLTFKYPKDKLEAIEWIYDLVYMIYLDGQVEDIELEITTEFAKELGFQPHIVNDLLKAIVTAPYDGIDNEDVRDEIKQIVNESLGSL